MRELCTEWCSQKKYSKVAILLKSGPSDPIREGNQLNDMGKNLLLWLIIAAVLLTVFNNFSVKQGPEEVDYSVFVEWVNQNQVREVTFDGLVVRGEKFSGESFETIQPQVGDKALIDDMIDHNVSFKGSRPEQQSIWTQLLVASFPILVIIAVFMFFMRQMQGGSGGRGGPLTFGKSKAKLLGEDQIKTTFADVAGVDEAKEDVQELVEFLRDPGKFQKLGGRIPQGILMVGQPGTGKTLLAKAIAGEAKVPFFSISGSDFVEMFVGVGASTGELVSVVATMNANRHSINCWSKWTVSTGTKA